MATQQPQESQFGNLSDGTAVNQFTLVNSYGFTAKVMTYGAALTELHVPDRSGKFKDVICAFDTLAGYESKANPYFGATTGRYANRIDQGLFTLDGKTYQLNKNDGAHSLHGGIKGFNRVVWNAQALQTAEGPAVKFSYLSRDGEENYPGNLSVDVTYTLTKNNELKIEYKATTDKPTIINLTNHAYYNLAGADDGSILGQLLYMNSDEYTPVGASLIPTGEIKSLRGTPFDFSKPTPIGQRIEQAGGNPTGYDHNYIIKGGAKKLTLAARVEDPKSGRVMEVLTTEPAIQFYSGNFLNGTIKGKKATVYNKHAAFCLEPQHYPDSPNQSKFPSTLLRPGQTYHQLSVCKFSVKG